MVDLRYYDYVPAMGRKGAVICVSGRTAAYRRSVILPVLPNLEHEFFLGRRCIAGDDGRLTWLVLASGYKTVHQSTARALSMFPDTLPGLRQAARAVEPQLGRGPTSPRSGRDGCGGCRSSPR